MFHIKKGLWMVGIPFVISLIAVIKNSAVLFALYIPVHFLILRLTPALKHCENTGMFVMVAISSIPVNIYVFGLMIETGVFFGEHLLVNIFRAILYYMVLLSIEEIVMGTLTRWFWKKQYKTIN